jgi:hypothetical protein
MPFLLSLHLSELLYTMLPSMVRVHVKDYTRNCVNPVEICNRNPDHWVIIMGC